MNAILSELYVIKISKSIKMKYYCGNFKQNKKSSLNFWQFSYFLKWWHIIYVEYTNNIYHVKKKIEDLFEKKKMLESWM